METTVGQRITLLIDHYCGGSEKRFAESLGVSPAVINNYTNGKQQSKPGFDMLHKICTTYPQIQIEWLISGYGEMLKQTVEQKHVATAHSAMRNIPLLDVKAAANGKGGYLPESPYITSEEVIHLPHHLVRGGRHIAVTVRGDSMSPTLQHGDIIICKEIEPNRWQELSQQEVCLVESEDNGLQVKRIENRLPQDGMIICLSDNPEHAPFQLSHEQIRQIWQVCWRLSGYLEPPAALRAIA
jgi:phage repressor protein C with HTH and peptisase S24 domain